MDGGRYRFRDEGAVFSFPLLGRVGDFDKRRRPDGFDIADAGRERVAGGESVGLPPFRIGIRDVGGVVRWRVPRLPESGGVG